MRSSTRATSIGSDAQWNELGFFSGSSRVNVPVSTSSSVSVRPFLVRAGAPVHPVGLGELGDLFDPGQQAGMGRRRIGLVGVSGGCGARPLRSLGLFRAVGGRGRHAGGSLLTHRGGATTGRRTLRRNDVDMGVSRSGRWDVPATVRRIDRGARPEQCEAPHKVRTLSGRTTFLRADQALLCCPIPTDGTARSRGDANACSRCAIRPGRPELAIPALTRTNRKSGRFADFMLAAMPAARLTRRVCRWCMSSRPTLPSARSSTDRASDYGSEGWGFESLRARHMTRRSDAGAHAVTDAGLRCAIRSLTLAHWEHSRRRRQGHDDHRLGPSLEVDQDRHGVGERRAASSVERDWALPSVAREPVAPLLLALGVGGGANRLVRLQARTETTADGCC